MAVVGKINEILNGLERFRPFGRVVCRKQFLEIAPLAYMRGRTLANATPCVGSAR